MPDERVLLKASKAKAGDPAAHAGEIIRHKRAGEAERLEIVPAAIGGDDRDAHLGHDLQETSLNGRLVIMHALFQRHVAIKTAAMPVSDGILREIGVHAGRADADEHGEVMRIQTFG